MWRPQLLSVGAVLFLTGSLLAGLAGSSGAQSTPPPGSPVSLASLKKVAVPEPPNLHEFVRNRAAAIRLGKALFWDMQVGSDGVQACASCHFHAGADRRLKNQLSPGFLGGDAAYASGAGPNYTLQPEDFPFHKLADVDDRNSTVLSDRNDVVSSQGVFRHRFVDVVPGDALDRGVLLPDPMFQVGGINVRRVEPRNTPTVINAVFNFRNFWDGRAQNEFNGVNPFGSRDPDARVLKLGAPGLELVRVLLRDSSLASQAVGPPTNEFESSFDGRIFMKVGKKLIGDYGTRSRPLIPLGKQIVHPKDSVLGSIARSKMHPPQPGLQLSYAQMIQAAFQPQWWASNKIVTVDRDGRVVRISDRPRRPLSTDEFTMMEANFSLFWGIALQLYQATLISDETPFDRFMEGDSEALTAEQKQGLDIFNRVGCARCHGGPETTNASVANVRSRRLLRMRMGDGGQAVYDTSFYNIGVRPTREDPGVGGTDPYGYPLSDTRMAQLGLFWDHNLNPAPQPGERVAVMGAFKVPGLRNVELTAPFFHNGGQATLLQVVEFYNRGGDFAGENRADLDPGMRPLGLTLAEKQALVAFLKALTDPRVRYERAPFDHPQIFVPNGHPGNEHGVTNDGTGKATDALLEIPAVGADGGRALPATFPEAVPAVTASNRP